MTPPGAVELPLPWPPSVNHYWGERVVRSGARWVIQKYVAEEGKAYRTAAWALLLGCGRPKLFGRLAVEICAHPPDRRRRDLDNLFKGVLDSLQAAGLYDDDEQIDDLHIRRRPVHPGGRIVVRAWRIEA